MNERESRFLRIKRYSDDDIEQLHHKERNAGKDWLIAGVQAMNLLDARLGSYYEAGKPEEEKAREIAAFQACPVVRREFAKLDATELDELPALHLADWVIYKHGYTPNFGKGSGFNRDKLAALYAPKSLPYADD